MQSSHFQIYTLFEHCCRYTFELWTQTFCWSKCSRMFSLNFFIPLLHSLGTTTNTSPASNSPQLPQFPPLQQRLPTIPNSFVGDDVGAALRSLSAGSNNNLQNTIGDGWQPLTSPGGRHAEPLAPNVPARTFNAVLQTVTSSTQRPQQSFGNSSPLHHAFSGHSLQPVFPGVCVLLVTNISIPYMHKIYPKPPRLLGHFRILGPPYDTF